MSRPPESSAGLELPKFGDRLPDLVQALRDAGKELESAPKQQSYLPSWEDLYAVAHSLKGVLELLSCPEPLARFIRDFNQLLLDGLSGPCVCRKTQAAGAAFLQLASLLDSDTPETIDVAILNKWLEEFRPLYDLDVDHAERLKEIPPHLFYVNEFVSKKAREITLLKLNHLAVEDEILLDDIPLWRTQLKQALVSPEFGRGILVNFLPFLSSEGSRHLKVWAWVAAGSHTRASLKQRIKEIMPSTRLGKV